METIVVGGVLVVVAVTAFLVLWSYPEDPLHGMIVEGLAGPQRASAPPASAPVVQPVSTLPPKAAAPSSISVLFEFDSAALREAEAAKLDALLRSAPDAGFKRLDAAGHADRVGPAAYNMKLSGRRAASVRDYLVDREVDPALVHTSAKGELESVTGDGCLDMGPELRGNAGLVDCLQPDRRVELTVIVK